MSLGEEKTFALTVPEGDFEEDVAGQEVAVSVQVHTVREQDLPAMDDELAMMVGDYDSLDGLRAALREEMETAALQKLESEYLDTVLDAMIEAAAKIEYPPQAVDREANLILGQMERNLAASGLQLDTYLGMIGKTREGYRQELRPSAEERLKKRLVLDEIARLENLEVDTEAVEAEIERLSEMMGPNAEQMREMLQSPEGRQSLSEDLITAKAQELATQIGKGEVGAEAEVEEEAEVAVEEEVEEETEVEVEEEAGAELGEAEADEESEAVAAN